MAPGTTLGLSRFCPPAPAQVMPDLAYLMDQYFSKFKVHVNRLGVFKYMFGLGGSGVEPESLHFS